MFPVNILSRNMAEVVTVEEAEKLDPESSTAYIGFEPSGLPHIATGILWTMKVKELAEAGIRVTVLLADLHSQINDKLGGDLQRIRESGRMIERCMKAYGLPSDVEFKWATDLVNNMDYWTTLIKVAKSSTLSRLKRSLPIMGRTEEDAEGDFSKFIYPLMQVTDIVYSGFDIALGGMDQRHAHMLQRDIAERMGVKKVVSVHGNLLESLKGTGRMDPFKKMSKSDADSAIFMTDSETEVVRKISSAFCPVKETSGNPVVDILKYIILPYSEDGIEIVRPPSKGGAISFTDFAEFSRVYEKGEIHPLDLKKAVASGLNNLMEKGRRALAADLSPM
ncbi:MAG: tyrosine--tRNA ligase [Thermoplasmataceae archaeon]|jgi:tyrosyl-tRNA synthetase